MCHRTRHYLPRPPAKNHVIAKPVRTLAVAIRLPRPLGPLPKGGWHGEAVTGGFLSRRTSCNAFVGAGFYPARGRGRAPPLRTTRYAFVGADAYIGPPYQPPSCPQGGTHVSRRPPTTALLAKTCHCEASAHTGCGNPQLQRLHTPKTTGPRPVVF